MATLAVIELQHTKFTGKQRAIYNSTRTVGRGFCRDCGTTLTWETDFGDEGPICAIHISTFDTPEKIKPTAHSFYSEKLPWFDVLDDLPRHRGFVRGTEPLHYGPPEKPLTDR